MNQNEHNILITLELTFSRPWMRKAPRTSLLLLKKRLMDIINLINNTLEETK